MLLFVIDGAGTESRNPADDLHCLMNELSEYDYSLLKKPMFVFSNKSDVKGTKLDYELFFNIIFTLISHKLFLGAKVKRRHLAQAVSDLGLTLIDGR